VLHERDHSPFFTAGLTKSRTGLPDPSKYTVCRKRLSWGWLVDLRFELGLTHTSVKEPVAIRSGWGLIKVQSALQIIYSATGSETLNVTYLKCPN
jgi:hypothetical protein